MFSGNNCWFYCDQTTTHTHTHNRLDSYLLLVQFNQMFVLMLCWNGHKPIEQCHCQLPRLYAKHPIPMGTGHGRPRQSISCKSQT